MWARDGRRYTRRRATTRRRPARRAPGRSCNDHGRSRMNTVGHPQLPRAPRGGRLRRIPAADCADTEEFAGQSCPVGEYSATGSVVGVTGAGVSVRGSMAEWVSAIAAVIAAVFAGAAWVVARRASADSRRSADASESAPQQPPTVQQLPRRRRSVTSNAQMSPGSSSNRQTTCAGRSSTAISA